VVTGDSLGHLNEGLYESIISGALEVDLERAQAAGFHIDRDRLGQAEAPRSLSTYFQKLLEERLAHLDDDERILVVNHLINELGSRDPADVVGDLVTAEPKPLLTLVSSSQGGLTPWRPPRPEIPLSTSDLLMNNRQGPTMSRSLASEMASADNISIIMSFIMWSGVRLLLPALREAVERGARVRVLTTTYMGATQLRAINALVEVGAEVRINFDTQGTRLHAKGWLFQRASGLSTAYVGSSNMSHAAMNAGQEWNVRMSATETPHLLHKFQAVFTSFWDNPGNGFEPYDPRTRPTDAARLASALRIARGGSAHAPLGDDAILPYDIEPLPFQKKMLEDLDREREVFGRRRNLVVAATGTGKTLLAAFDYRRLVRRGELGGIGGRRPRLLYVAHRAEILRQARRAFRHVLRDPNFGELLVDGATPQSNEFVFASIQSLNEVRLNALEADFYDYIVIDEFHHAGARTWSRLLELVDPKFLVGLTATPERADGIDILHWFGGHTATEIRLWEALERNLLVPFHYFGVGDEALDFRSVSWIGGKYNVAELEGILTGDDAFMHRVVNEITDKVTDPRVMRALVFTVSIAHARYVARFLEARGIHAQALTSEEGSPERQEAVRKLRTGEVQALVTVDLFNEGVDIPEVDTVVLLRPTESQTVFLQQLGRGLRHSPSKEVLTVLDFVGMQNKKFRYDLRFQALTGTQRRKLEQVVEAGFPYLPSGCSIQLDRIASSIVLENIRATVPNRARELVRDIRELLPSDSPIDGSLRRFLEDSGRELPDIYRDRKRSWTGLLRQAGRSIGTSSPLEDYLLSRVCSLVHIDDLPRIETYRGLVSGSITSFEVPEVKAFATMLHHTLWSSTRREWLAEGDDRLFEGLELLHREPSAVEELLQVFDVAEERIKYVTFPLDGHLDALPVRVHARYNRAEMLAGVGWANVDTGVAGQVAGVRFVPSIQSDVFDVTWQKSERDYSPNTMYQDYAISPTLLNWESQHAAHRDSQAIQRYVNHEQSGTHILIFARESKSWEFASARPFLFLGDAHYVSHHGDRPVTFRWELERPLPADFFTASEVLAG
jgi:superfamily II DNA or RNA helicase/HKD family nuclease